MSSHHNNSTKPKTSPTAALILPNSKPIDFDAFATHKHTYTVSSIAHAASANVHPLTVHISALISESFAVPLRGDRNVSDAFNNLPILDSGDWAFGFGLDHVVRAAWNWGVLPNVLMEYYDANFSATVMHELAKAIGVPKEMRPSQRQWERLMIASSGVLAASRLGTVIGDLVRLNPYDTVISSGLGPGSNGPIRRYATPESIAEALGALSAVSRGEEDGITVMGANDIGWLAAVSEWLLNMRVTIKDMTGNPVYCNCSGTHKRPEIDLVFEEKGNGGLEKSFADLQLRHVGHVIRLVDSPIQEDNVENGVLVKLPPALGGRVEWGNLFRLVYKDAWDSVIHEDVLTIGTSVACAARALQGLAEDEPGVPESLKKSVWISNPSSYGPGLVETLKNWFIGFTRATANMNHHLKLSLADAVTTYEAQMVKLAKLCGCEVCFPGSKVQKEFCKLVLIESLVTFGVGLSRMVLVPQLFPRESGVVLVYHHQVRMLRAAQEEKLTGLERIARVYRDTFQADNKIMLQISSAIFGGVSVPADIDPNALAMTSNGICSCTGMLYKFSGRNANKGDIRVVPGTIQFCGRVYDRVLGYDGFERDVGEAKTLNEADEKIEVVMPDGVDIPLVIKRRGGMGQPEGNGKI